MHAFAPNAGQRNRISNNKQGIPQANNMRSCAKPLNPGARDNTLAARHLRRDAAEVRVLLPVLLSWNYTKRQELRASSAFPHVAT